MEESSKEGKLMEAKDHTIEGSRNEEEKVYKLQNTKILPISHIGASSNDVDGYRHWRVDPDELQGSHFKDKDIEGTMAAKPKESTPPSALENMSTKNPHPPVIICLCKFHNHANARPIFMHVETCNFSGPKHSPAYADFTNMPCLHSCMPNHLTFQNQSIFQLINISRKPVYRLVLFHNNNNLFSKDNTYMEHRSYAFLMNM
ncbi:hypothetical protein M9H77_06815 [Catharanthus roseus]|uniref:Uncharacterized protein n=1 Tax=Catharanthus roseus TaxID=4058 RepID=A0ACC0BT73_CATRO|nr:hypothetical protein M9H77_06815 [Catharanthus roseus]